MRMRKYQQLLLLLCCCFSVAVLLMYKSENNRLKYVLQVVNFFGRSDVAVLKHLDNGTNIDEWDQFAQPLPVWQLIGDAFHAYGAFWSRNELVAGGEALALVTGRRGAIVNFRCTLWYDNGASVQGKFRFQRVDSSNEDANSDFTSYSFFCRVMRDFGQPASVTFGDLTAAVSKTSQMLRLRYIKNIDVKQKQFTPELATICLDMINYNASSHFASDTTNLLQFFLHHQTLGIKHFLIYNGDAVPQSVMRLLRRMNMRLHLLPFNFPFSPKNATERIRRIIETDCLMRNTHLARHTLLLEANEFFIPNAKLDDSRTVLRSLQHYSAEVTRFELPTFAVCMDHSHKLLLDNSLYDPEVLQTHRLFLYRPQVTISSSMTDSAAAAAVANTPANTRSVSLPLSLALAHRYINCVHVGKDGLHDWRNSLREDFMLNIQAVRNEIDILI